MKNLSGWFEKKMILPLGISILPRMMTHRTKFHDIDVSQNNKKDMKPILFRTYKNLFPFLFCFFIQSKE